MVLHIAESLLSLSVLIIVIVHGSFISHYLHKINIERKVYSHNTWLQDKIIIIITVCTGHKMCMVVKAVDRISFKIIILGIYS